MKKTSKLFGAMALSAALAVGTAMPAFAAPDIDANGDPQPVVEWTTDDDGNIKPDTIKDGSDSSTPVYIDVKKSNINVAVPIELRLVAETAGGPLVCPSNDVYGVYNYSTNTAVYINKVETVYNEDANKDGANWLLVQDGALVGDGVESAIGGPAYGNLMVELSAPSASDTTAEGTPVVGDTYTLKVGDDGAKIPTKAKAWKIAQAGKDGDKVLQRFFPLNFTENSKSSIVQDVDAANLFAQGDGADRAAADAFKLKYTISTSRPKA